MRVIKTTLEPRKRRDKNTVRAHSTHDAGVPAWRLGVGGEGGPLEGHLDRLHVAAEHWPSQSMGKDRELDRWHRGISWRVGGDSGPASMRGGGQGGGICWGFCATAVPPTAREGRGVTEKERRTPNTKKNAARRKRRRRRRGAAGMCVRSGTQAHGRRGQQ
jgi:hypothetical protein